MKKALLNQTFLLVGVIALTSSCSLMLPERSFINEMELSDSESFLTPGVDYPVVNGDTGNARRTREEIQRRTPQSERSRAMLAETESIERELIEKEDRLSEDELETYSRNKKFLQTDSDKLYYLSLSPYERETYIGTKKTDLKSELNERRNMVSRRSVHGSELFVGMDKSEVVEVWGRPVRVEIAGNPKNQNERWSFVEDGSTKQIYFEGGKVQGWALDL